jgi:hypothetical protein
LAFARSCLDPQFLAATINASKELIGVETPEFFVRHVFMLPTKDVEKMTTITVR